MATPAPGPLPKRTPNPSLETPAPAAAKKLFPVSDWEEMGVGDQRVQILADERGNVVGFRTDRPPQVIRVSHVNKEGYEASTFSKEWMFETAKTFVLGFNSMQNTLKTKNLLNRTGGLKAHVGVELDPNAKKFIFFDRTIQPAYSSWLRTKLFDKASPVLAKFSGLTDDAWKHYGDVLAGSVELKARAWKKFEPLPVRGLPRPQGDTSCFAGTAVYALGLLYGDRIKTLAETGHATARALQSLQQQLLAPKRKTDMPPATSAETLLKAVGWEKGIKTQQDASEFFDVMAYRLRIEDFPKDDADHHLTPYLNPAQNRPKVGSPDRRVADKLVRVCADYGIGNMPPVIALKIDRASQGFKERAELALPERVVIKGMVYELTLANHHAGASMNSGHYHNYFKKEGQWYHQDDDKVSKVSFAEVEAATRQDSNMVFYKQAGRELPKRRASVSSAAKPGSGAAAAAKPQTRRKSVS